MSTKNLIVISCLLAFIVITLGAYVRLSDAGLGCPDWPGCYGKLLVPSADNHIEQANDLYPERPVEEGKAWKEMIHRYAAGFLLLLVITITYRNYVNRKENPSAAVVSYLLLALIIFQALLGMWTVTLLLKPVVVMSHLLGGMTVFLLLTMLLHSSCKKTTASNSRWFPYAVIALITVYLQIFLGGWTSANYAALVCSDFPTCQNSWWPMMDFSNGFTFWTGLGKNYEFGLLEPAARTAIHFTHRIGAVLTLLIVGGITLTAYLNTAGMQKLFAGTSLGLLFIQLVLGVLNIILVLPIGVAVAHNGVAALLLISIGSFLYYSLPNRST